MKGFPWDKGPNGSLETKGFPWGKNNSYHVGFLESIALRAFVTTNDDVFLQ